MPINISTPDGSNFSFPDNTSMDVIHGALDQHFGTNAAQPQQATPNPNGSAQPQPQVGYGADIAKGVGSGLVQGAISPVTLAGDVESLLPNKQQPEPQGAYGALVHGLNKAREWASLPTSEGVTRGLRGVIGAPETKLGQYAETGASFLPAAIGGEGSVAARLLKNVAAPAVATETAGQLTAGTPIEPLARIGAGVATGHLIGTAGNVAQNSRTIKAAKDIKSSDFFDAAEPLYSQARSTNVEYAQPAVENVANSIKKQMIDEGETERNASAAHGAIDAFRNEAAKGFVTAQDIQNTLSEVKKNMRKGVDVHGSGVIADGLHDFLESAPNIPNAVRAGDGRAAAQLYSDANANWKTGKLMKALEAAEERGSQAAGSANSGQNLDNATRQAIKTLIRPNINGVVPAKRMGFNDSEIALMRQVVQGNAPGNVLRYVGNLLGKGGGVVQGVLGIEGIKEWYENGDPRLMMAALAGKAAGKIANQATAANLARAKIAVANRVPAGQQAAPLSYPRAALGRTAITNAVLARAGMNPRSPSQ
jgi:hypothetical protein